jgi:MFS family permease
VPYSGEFNIFSLMKEYFFESFKSAKIFTKNTKVYLLTLAIMLTTIVQILGNSYYGIFIYENFKHQFLKGFLNVAVIFTIAIIASISGTFFTKTFSKSIGEAPMLVFGTLLIALMPFTIYYNPHLYAIGLATALSVIGGAIVGVAQGLIAERLMNEDELKTYFSSISFVSIIPIILLVSLGAILAQTISLNFLFLVLAIVLALVIMPIYFIIVVIVDKEYRKEKTNK